MILFFFFKYIDYILKFFFCIFIYFRMKNLLFILVVLLLWCLIDIIGGVVIYFRCVGWCFCVCYFVCYFVCLICYKECDIVCEDVCCRKKSGVRILLINECVYFFGIFLFLIYILIFFI